MSGSKAGPAWPSAPVLMCVPLADTAVGLRCFSLAVAPQLKVIYAQASIRYAWLLDQDMAGGLPIEDHQAEARCPTSQLSRV